MDAEPQLLRILVIEDDEDDYVLVRDLLSELRSSPFQLDWVTTYEEGFSALCSNEYDIYLLDYRLGDRNGLELLREATAGGCTGTVIFLTGQGDYEIDIEAMKAGAADYFIKGQITTDLLERSIRYSVERARTERALRKARDELEIRVLERTAELEGANEELRAEIAERKKAEHALEASEGRCRVLVESALDIIYTVSAEGRIISLNPEFEKVTGWSAQEWIGKEFTHLLHPEDLPLLLDRFKKIISGQILPAAEARILSKSGQYRTLEFKTVPRMEAGKVAGVIGTARDITDRRVMEEALRKAHDELELRVMERTLELGRANQALMIEIVERERAERALRLDEMRLGALWELSQMSAVSITEVSDFVLEQQVKITRSKIGSLSFLNDDETTLTIRSWSKGVVESCGLTRAAMHCAVERAAIWKDTLRERKPIIINDYLSYEPLERGEIPLSRLMSIPLFEGNRIIVVAVVGNKDEDYDESDVRQVKLLLDGMWRFIQHERAERALREAESLAAMGRALSSVAHDMKTPLIAIGGFARIVQRHLGEDNPDRARLEIVLKETQRLETLVRDMLDFSKPLELDRGEEDISRVISESLAVVEAAARKRKVGVQCKSSRSRGVPVLIDSMRMKQVIINLVMNAIDASPKGETVRVLERLNGRSLVIDVTDHGCGIPFDKRKEIFSPFFTTKKEGTGLGLAIVRKIVEAHGGRVEILDNPEGGVTFRVMLPIAP